jgi:glyoxylase-like metal-dependent hydrolase (beta-lactamase superfamily II)
MEIKTFVLGELETNCYLVWDEKTKEGLIIDPADEANFLSEQVLEQGIKPLYLLATHGHFDHLLAAYELELAFKIPLLVHQDDLPLVKKMLPSATWWLKRRVMEKPPKKINFIKEGDQIKLGKTVLEVIHTPGHSPGGICLYGPKENILFTGDTLFAQGVVGRTDLSYSSAKALKESLKKLTRLPTETVIYPGHGPSASLQVRGK